MVKKSLRWDASSLNHSEFCVSQRASHRNPNLAQIPAVRAPYGKECRDLFTVRPGFKLVGADYAGLELRMLAHYMAKFDGGKFAKEVDSRRYTYNKF